MLRELSDTPLSDLVLKYLTKLPEIAMIDHFKDAALLRENALKNVMEIIKGIGKKKFRGYVELFLDAAFRNAKGTNDNCGAVA